MHINRNLNTHVYMTENTGKNKGINKGLNMDMNRVKIWA